MTAKITIGEFTYNHKSGVVIGPADYMEKRGDRLLEEIELGNNQAFNREVQAGPGIDGAEVMRRILGALQADYELYRGN